jgi:uncharacterized caspase-like protein
VATDHKRYAVVVGISEYDEEDISALPFAKNDASRVASILRRHAMFESNRVYLLANGFKDASENHCDLPTRANILQKLKYVCETAGPDDLILFYFAGHGVEMSKTPYLLLCDTKMDVLSETALNIDKINDMLEKTQAKCIVRFFDSCRIPFAEARGGLGRMTAGFEQAVLKCAKGWANFCSCSSGEVAHESGEFSQGVFSYYLCEGLTGKARNTEGNVSIESLVDYVKTSVGNWCDRQTQIQTPHFQSDLSGSLILTSPSQPIEKQKATPDDPFSELIAGLESHLGKVVEDVRRLTFTTVEECKTIAELLHARIKAKFENFTHPALKTEISEVLPFYPPPRNYATAKTTYRRYDIVQSRDSL